MFKKLQDSENPEYALWWKHHKTIYKYVKLSKKNLKITKNHEKFKNHEKT